MEKAVFNQGGVQMGKQLFGALLHTHWIADKSPTRIRGKWPEELTEYEIFVPEQLRDLLVELQNALSTRYQDLMLLRKRVADLERATDYATFTPCESDSITDN